MELNEILSGEATEQPTANVAPWAPTGDLIFDLMTGRITLESAGPYGTDM